ncbi:MAG: nucleotidyltransferase family protein [Candidatus Eiseniibacteriota bacterium]
MRDTNEIVAVVLAAGASSRLGRAKALLRFGERSALDLVLDALRGAGLDAGVIVTGEADAELRAAVDAAPFAWVRNPNPDAGRLGSIRVGLEAAARGAVLLWPVDRPLAARDTVRILLENARRFPGKVVVPESCGRRGHPLVLPESLRPALAAVPPDASLREVLAASGAARHVVALDDPGIHHDLDTEEAYAEALAWWRQSNYPFR